MNSRVLLYIGVALIGAALFAIRSIAPEFRLGTTTETHPYILFAGLLIGANVVWFFFIPILASQDQPLSRRHMPIKTWVWFLLLIGLLYRALFFSSTPVYEDDWNRYLWDGAVILQGENPYRYSPKDIMDDADLAHLKQYAEDRGDILRRINNKELTTIYPPVAQGAFAFAAILAPLNLDALRFIYLISEALTFFLLIKTLPKYGRSPHWVLLYAYSPLLIYSAFNVAHMDILLSPFIVMTLLWIKRIPALAGMTLSLAAAVKIWPLILAPVLYRSHLKRPVIYGACAVLITVLSGALLYPMLRELGGDSGLQAYSEHWRRSSFLFPFLESTLDFVFDNPGRIARYIVAGLVTLTSVWYGFFSRFDEHNDLPARLMIITLVLLLLSPTGFPWYAIWFIIFLPFAPSYGAALLCVLLPLYYVRFALGEAGNYHIYTNILTPLQFGLPMLILLFELMSRRRYG